MAGEKEHKQQAGERGFEILGEGESETRPGAAAAFPPVTFGTFVLSLSASALVHLGEAPSPESEKPGSPNLPMVRHTIDILAMLEEKTRGNLQPEEKELLEAVIHDLRMRYVRLSEPPR